MDMHDKFLAAIIILVTLVIGVQIGIRQGRKLEAADHRKYVRMVTADSDENCTDGPCEATDK